MSDREPLVDRLELAANRIAIRIPSTVNMTISPAERDDLGDLLREAADYVRDNPPIVDTDLF